MKWSVVRRKLGKVDRAIDKAIADLKAKKSDLSKKNKELMACRENLMRLEDKLEAAIAGAQRMAVPVTFAILTTIAAFAPMFFVPGFSGKLFRIMPAVIVSVLIFSLLESFFILPAHLAHLKAKNFGKGVLGWIEPSWD